MATLPVVMESQKGVADGVAPLGPDGIVPEQHLPSTINDIKEDTTAIKEDTEALQTDLTEAKTDLAAAKTDLAQVKKDTGNLITILKRKPICFGFKRIQEDSNPESRIIYTHEAVGMTPAKMGAESFSYGDWADAWFVAGNYPCMLKPDGTEAYRLNPNDYAKRADSGEASGIENAEGDLNAMAAIPTIWVKRYMEGKDECVVFCQERYDDSFHAFAHTDAKGVIKAHAYHAIFEGSKDSAGKLRSISGAAPWNTTGGIEPERTAVKKNGTDWDIRPASFNFLVADMCTMISKNDNSQAAFGNGNMSAGTGAEHLLNTGMLNTKGQFWGDTVGATSGVKIFHMENFYGNRWERLIGLVQQGGSFLVKMTPEGAGYNLTGAGYDAFPVGIGQVANTNGSGGQHLTYTCDLGTLPYGATFDGTATTYTSDWLWWNVLLTTIALAGGCCSYGARVGVRCLALSLAASWSYWDLGGSPFKI